MTGFELHFKDNLRPGSKSFLEGEVGIICQGEQTLTTDPS